MNEKRAKVYVGLVAYESRAELGTIYAIERAKQECRCEIYGGVGVGDGLGRARNNLVADFLKTDCTHFLSLDSDVLFQPRHIDKLVDDALSIVFGLYAKKQPMLNWVASSLGGEIRDEKTGLQKVAEAGTGFGLIKREVIENMIEANPFIEYDDDAPGRPVRWDLFPLRAKNRRYESEDWAFCARAREMGYPIYVDWGVHLKHIGKIQFPLCETLTMEEMIDLVKHATGKSDADVRSFIESTNEPKR